MCGNKSKQTNSYFHIFLEFECPVDGTIISEFIASKLNKPETVIDWRDEDGCNKRG